jgi:hypothetical protein
MQHKQSERRNKITRRSSNMVVCFLALLRESWLVLVVGLWVCLFYRYGLKLYGLVQGYLLVLGQVVGA